MSEMHLLLVKEFYEFLAERERIRLRRFHGLPREQWTKDEIFREYRFTNVKRHHDRVTTLLKREFYDPAISRMSEFSLDELNGAAMKPMLRDKIIFADVELCEVLLNCALFRYLGTIEAARALGWTKEWTPEARTRFVGLGMRGQLPFTGSYIIPAGGRTDPKIVVVAEIIDDIVKHAPAVVREAKWENAVYVMTDCYGVGSFMAKEVYLDFVLATGREPTDWQTWTPVGPGGRRGASVVKDGHADKIPEWEALQVIRAIYARRAEFMPEVLHVESRRPDGEIQQMWTHEAPSLDLTDIQFVLCEFDKYQRVVRKDGKPKRRFWPKEDDVTRGPE